jgi:hypothetical protein
LAKPNPLLFKGGFEKPLPPFSGKWNYQLWKMAGSYLEKVLDYGNPDAHWPDSMFSYVKEENYSFPATPSVSIMPGRSGLTTRSGSHYAQARKYFANILLYALILQLVDKIT